MKYILDTNSLSNEVLAKSHTRKDLCALQEVIDETASNGIRVSRIQSSGVETLEMKTAHFNKLKEILTKEGDNFDLIRLYTNEGAADVAMLAYALSEKENPEGLFPEEYTIVTKDKGLIEAGKKYGIKTIKKL